MSEKKPIFSAEDIEQMARSYGKPPSASLRKKVMDKIDAIDRDIARGKTIEPPAPEGKSKQKRKGPGGRGSIGD